jgi:hypothetical protein
MVFPIRQDCRGEEKSRLATQVVMAEAPIHLALPPLHAASEALLRIFALCLARAFFVAKNKNLL